MAKIIAIANQKGGVGKTTTSVNLTAILADMGQRVLAVDLDPQGNTTSGLGMTVEDKSVYEAVMGRIGLKEAVQHTDIPGLDLVGADIRLAGEVTLDLLRHLHGQVGPAVVHGEQQALQTDGGVQPALDNADGGEQIAQPLQGVILALDGHQHRVCRAEAV